MKDEIKFAIYLMVMGAALVTYAHANFATKSVVETMDNRIYEIWKEIVRK